MARTKRIAFVLLIALAVLLSLAPAALADARQAALTSTRGVSISPTNGAPGTIVQVHAWGMGRYANVTVGIGPQGAGPTHTHSVGANEAGELWTTVTIPHNAGTGTFWVVTARTNAEVTTSPTFRVDGSAPPTTSPCGSHYVVRPGDWLFSIARTCQVSVTDLLRANPQITNPSIIFVGQVLVIPAVGPPPPPPPGMSPCGNTYIVRRGDWLSQIARTCQVSLADLLRVNPQITNPNLLYAGQVLNIPGVGTPPAPPSVTVTATTRFNVNFRPLPTTGTTVIATIRTGTTVPVLARGPAGWIYVRYGGRDGWVAGWLCNIHGDLGALPYRPS